MLLEQIYNAQLNSPRIATQTGFPFQTEPSSFCWASSYVFSFLDFIEFYCDLNVQDFPH